MKKQHSFGDLRHPGVEKEQYVIQGAYLCLPILQNSPAVHI